MRILFLTRKFWPSIGGVEKHCLEVARELVKKGNEVTIISEESNDFEKTGEIEGIKLYRIPITTKEKLKKFQIWSWLWKNIKLIKEADIVHCHDVFFWYFPFRFLFLKKKVFVTFHGWEGKFPPAFKAKIIRKISEKLSLGNICVGDFIKKWYGTKPNFVTYGGVNVYEKINIKSQNQNSNIPKILFIGRLEEDTGLPLYLRALEILKNRGFECRVEFAGDGRLKNEAEKHGRVLGFIRNVEKHIQDSDFVFTSGYLSILEAMINQKLIFSVYDNPLKEDYLKLAPFFKWVIIENDPEELSQKIKYYFNDPKEQQEMILKAYLWAKEQSWEKVSEIYLNLWKK